MSEQVYEPDRADHGLLEALRIEGLQVDACYQCLRCAAGCPMLPFMDIAPNKIIRMLQYGLEQQVLSSNAIWMCASCQTCTTRCPNEVDIAHMMDFLRQEAIAQGIKCPEPTVMKFHRAFLKGIRRGRVHELSMLMRYKLATGRFSDDMKLGMRMFSRGRIKLMPPKRRAHEEIKRMFRKAEK